LHCKEPQASPSARLKLDEDIDVAVWSKVIAENRPKQRQAANAISAAKCGNLFLRQLNPVMTHDARLRLTMQAAPQGREQLTQRTLIMRTNRLEVHSQTLTHCRLKSSALATCVSQTRQNASEHFIGKFSRQHSAARCLIVSERIKLPQAFQRIAGPQSGDASISQWRFSCGGTEPSEAVGGFSVLEWSRRGSLVWRSYQGW
jgi:hypothetical protein